MQPLKMDYSISAGGMIRNSNSCNEFKVLIGVSNNMLDLLQCINQSNKGHSTCTMINFVQLSLRNKKHLGPLVHTPRCHVGLLKCFKKNQEWSFFTYYYIARLQETQVRYFDVIIANKSL